VALREVTPADRDEFLERVRASRSLHDPWVHPPDDPEAFLAFVQRSRAPDTRTFLAVRRDDGAIAGVFNLGHVVRGPLQSAYMGYYGFVPFDGQGYMGEALALVLAEIFGSLRLHRVEANVQPGNERSLALVRRAGFRKEGFSPRYLSIGGQWRDHERWALTIEDWRAG